MIELVSFANLKVFIGLDENEADYEDLTLIKDSITASFESFCNRQFELKERTFKKDYLHEIDLWCADAFPISSVASVKEGGVLVSDHSVFDNVITFQNGVKSLEIVYTGGLSSVPKDIERAALMQTAYEYKNKDSIGLEYVSSPNGGSITKPEIGLLKEVKQILSRYKRPITTF